MLNDLMKTIKAQLHERVGSPLLGSFAISWALWNYKFLLVVLSSASLSEKLWYIDADIFPSYEEAFLRGLLFPLISSALLIFAYPYPAKFVYEFWRNRQRELKEIQQKIDDETPLTREEARELRRENIKALSELEEQLERRAAEIARLRETISKDKFEGAISRTHETRPRGLVIDTGLTETQEAMLEDVSKQDRIAKKELINNQHTDQLVSEYDLGTLIKGNYVEQLTNTDKSVYITHKGRGYLIKRMSSGDNKTNPAEAGS